MVEFGVGPRSISVSFCLQTYVRVKVPQPEVGVWVPTSVALIAARRNLENAPDSPEGIERIPLLSVHGLLVSRGCPGLGPRVWFFPSSVGQWRPVLLIWSVPVYLPVDWDKIGCSRSLVSLPVLVLLRIGSGARSLLLLSLSDVYVFLLFFIWLKLEGRWDYLHPSRFKDRLWQPPFSLMMNNFKKWLLIEYN